MDKSTGFKTGKKTTTNNEEDLHKGAILQHLGPGRAFKGLGIAKQYCANESNSKWFAQGSLSTKPWW